MLKGLAWQIFEVKKKVMNQVYNINKSMKMPFAESFLWENTIYH